MIILTLKKHSSSVDLFAIILEFFIAKSRLRVVTGFIHDTLLDTQHLQTLLLRDIELLK